MEKTLNISEKELQSTLKDFLEEKEKPAESIWNTSTVTGLVLVFTAFSYIGHTIATEVIGLNSLPVIYTVMNIMPYIGGAFLGITILGMFKFNRRKKQKDREEEIRVRETYDKLDEFLYSEKEKRSGKAASAKASRTFSMNSSKMMRSRTDKYLSGVCGGLAKHLGISSTVIRIIFLAALFLGYGSFILVYIALSIIMPKEPISFMDDFN
ncbi:MAG: PspC domain-containing protein [Balneolaceae bacterium]